MNSIDIRFSGIPEDVLYTISNKRHFINAVEDAWSWTGLNEHSCYLACPECLPEEWHEVRSLTFYRGVAISEYEYHKAWCELMKARKYLDDLSEIVSESRLVSSQITEEAIKSSDS